jgi:peptidyl-prolyl cis-trans isomerase C
MAKIFSPLPRCVGVLALAALFFVPTTAALRAQESDPVVARANGVDIHQSDLAAAADEIGSNMPPLTEDKKRDYLITYLADVIVVAQAAQQQKLGDDPDVKRQLAFAHDKVLMEALLQKTGRAAQTDDAAMHKVYDQAVTKMPKEDEVHARHILVPTEQEAKDIVAQLKKGGDFATLAKQKSKDPGASNGGDLGWFTKSQMVPAFADAAFKLDKGQISDPVKTQFGWHVIEVMDKRVRPTPTFDQVKDQLKTYVARQAESQLVDNLRKTAKIERLDQPAAPKPSLNPAAPMSK